MTRHNVGFMVLDRFAKIEGIIFHGKSGGAQTGRGLVEEEDVVLAKPLSYMNRSGMVVKRLMQGLGISMDHLLVIHDDVDLPVGRIKIKRKGGDGGHKGIESIIESLGSDDFLRVKVGIGRPGDSETKTEYVLAPFADQQIPLLEENVERASQAVEAILLYGAEMAMNMYN